jgi:hypothetical protein
MVWRPHVGRPFPWEHQVKVLTLNGAVVMVVSVFCTLSIVCVHVRAPLVGLSEPVPCRYCSSDVAHWCVWRLIREPPCENNKSGSLIAPRFPFSCQHDLGFGFASCFILLWGNWLGLHPKRLSIPIICICFDQGPWSKVMCYLGNREPFGTQNQPLYRLCGRNAGSSWHFHECID